MTTLDADTELTLTVRAAMALYQIGRDWARVLDPIRTTSVSSSSAGPRYATEDEADQDQPLDPRHDAARILAFWVHAAVDEWPAILTTMHDGQLATATVDCSDVPAMARLLEREASRLAAWVESGHDYGQSFTEEVEHLANACRRIAHPPKGDRITIGDCPACGRRVRVKAPEWAWLPFPSTKPSVYPEWAWAPKRDRDVKCRCGVSLDLEGWRHLMATDGKDEPLTAVAMVEAIRQAFGIICKPDVLRQWKRRGMFGSVGQDNGENTYDRAQVFAALIDREQRRDAS